MPVRRMACRHRGDLIGCRGVLQQKAQAAPALLSVAGAGREELSPQAALPPALGDAGGNIAGRVAGAGFLVVLEAED